MKGPSKREQLEAHRWAWPVGWRGSGAPVAHLVAGSPVQPALPQLEGAVCCALGRRPVWQGCRRAKAKARLALGHEVAMVPGLVRGLVHTLAEGVVRVAGRIVQAALRRVAAVLGGIAAVLGVGLLLLLLGVAVVVLRAVVVLGHAGREVVLGVLGALPAACRRQGSCLLHEG